MIDDEGGAGAMMVQRTLEIDQLDQAFDHGLHCGGTYLEEKAFREQGMNHEQLQKKQQQTLSLKMPQIQEV